MAEPIRVLEVFHSMDCGGAENMIMNLYRRIDQEKLQFDFMVHSPEKGFFDDEIRALGGRIFVLPYFKVTNEKEYKKALREFFAAHPEIRVVHGHVGSCSHIYLKIAKEYNCYTIFHSHNTRKKLSVKTALFRLFTLQTRRTADYFMGCGKAAGDYLFGRKITSDGKRYRILNNAIDTRNFVYDEEMREKTRRELGLLDAFVVGHIGRFNDQKNHTYLIDIFSELVKKDPAARLLLVGEGNRKTEMEAKVKKLGLGEMVTFAGLRRDVPSLLMAMDCMVFPSHNEGLPVTVIEAQTSGLPCVLSDVITREVALTDLVSYAALKEPPQVWAEKALAQKGRERTDRQAEVTAAGYDIETTVKWLTDFYLGAYRRQQGNA